VGSIPKDIAYLSSLKTFDVQDNSLAGSLPGEIGQVKGLEVLYVNDNQLEGTLPNTIYDLPKINDFSISGNLFSGNIKSQVGMMGSLSGEKKRFMLQKNMFSGQVPTEFGIIPNLVYLGLYGNNFVGEVSNHLCGKNIDISVSCSQLYCNCCRCKR